MQEKIEKVVNQCIDWDNECLDPCFTVGAIVAAIAKLVERKVIWDRDISFEEDVDSAGDVAGWSELDDDYVVYLIDPNPNVPLGKILRMIVEDIDESRT